MALDELTTSNETNACNKGDKQMTLDNLTTVQQTDTPANGHRQPVTALEDIFFLPSDDQQPPLDVKWPDMEKDGANDFTTSLQPIFTPDIRPEVVMNNRAFKIDGLKMLMNDKTGAHLDVKKGQFIQRDHRYFFENVVIERWVTCVAHDLFYSIHADVCWLFLLVCVTLHVQQDVDKGRL